MLCRRLTSSKRDMGQDDNLQASLAHVVLCCVASNGLGRMSGRSYTHPGMHANCLLHGILGFVNFQSSTFGDLSAAYKISMAASKYLPIPCLMADMYRRDILNSNETLSYLHLLSGLVPFVLALTGKENPHLGHIVIAANVVSLGYYSIQNKREWGYYTTAAAIVAYFLAPQSGANANIVYPLALALMEYCATKLYHWEPPPTNRRGR